VDAYVLLAMTIDPRFIAGLPVLRQVFCHSE
jgi:hypothetical protein